MTVYGIRIEQKSIVIITDRIKLVFFINLSLYFLEIVLSKIFPRNKETTYPIPPLTIEIKLENIYFKPSVELGGTEVLMLKIR